MKEDREAAAIANVWGLHSYEESQGQTKPK
jgi:hypothetical protein